MFSEPDDPAASERMRVAFTTAATALGITPQPDAPMRWGHNGRTLSGPVNTASGRAWLRVMKAPQAKQGGKLWTGTEQADKVLPDEIARPRLLDHADWTADEHAYRAELTSYISAAVGSVSPDLTHPIDLPDAWWTDLRRAIETVTQIPPPQGRQPVISQEYVHRAVPEYVGAVGIDTTVRHWDLAHGDLHWSNITAPTLTILDWEGFGPAPRAFDAAHLHAYTLATPSIAERIQSHFRDHLDTPDGRLAQLTVAAIVLQAADRDPVHARLAPHVRAHARRLSTIDGI